MSYLFSIVKAAPWIGLALIGIFVSSTKVLGQSGPASEGRVGSDVEMPLLDGARCTYTSSRTTRDRLSSGAGLVSVNKRPFESQFSMLVRANHDGALTCLADSRTFPVLVLQMGVPDSEASRNPLATVNVYQRGNIIHSYSDVVPGSLINTTLALGDGEDFSVEFVCHRAGSAGNNSNCGLHFLEAKLYTAGAGGAIYSNPNPNGSASGGYRVGPSEPQANPAPSTGPNRSGNTSQGHTPPNSSGNVIEQTGDLIEDVEEVIEIFNGIFN